MNRKFKSILVSSNHFQKSVGKKKFSQNDFFFFFSSNLDLLL